MGGDEHPVGREDRADAERPHRWRQRTVGHRHIDRGHGNEQRRQRDPIGMNSAHPRRTRPPLHLRGNGIAMSPEAAPEDGVAAPARKAAPNNVCSRKTIDFKGLIAQAEAMT